MATIAEKLAAAAVTDSFLRNENPLSNGGKWVKPTWDTLIGECVLAEGWKPGTAFTAGTDGARWETALEAAGGNYVYAILELNKYSSTQEPERWWGAWICMDAAKQNGYRVRAEETTKGSNTHKIILEKIVEGAATELGKVEVELLPTEKPAIAVVLGEGNVYAFTKQKEGAAWVERVKKADATYTTGRSGIESKGNFFRGQNFRTGTFSLEEEAGVHKPNAASATASRPEPSVAQVAAPTAALATASMPNSEAVGGAMPSGTESEHKGLPLPFPTIVPNPQRLGPPRFTALERKTLGLDR